MQAITFGAMTAAAVLIVSGCAQMQGTPHPKAKALRTIIEGSTTEPYGNCSRGLFKTLVYKDWTQKGKTFVKAKGVMTAEPLKGVSPNYLLGDEPKVRGKNAPDTKNIKFIDLGESIELNLGEPSLFTERSVTSGSSKPLTVKLTKKNDIFLGESEITIAPPAEEEDAPPPSSPNRLGAIRAMLIEDRAIATDSGTLAASLPGLVESEEVTFSKGLKAVKIGPPFSISVAPSAPNGTTWFTVVISDASKEPKAAYIYRVKDEGQGEIHVPTEWAAKSGKREQLSALKPAWIRVIRSQLAEEPMTDGGNLCTETATGVLFEGEIQKSDK